MNSCNHTRPTDVSNQSEFDMMHHMPGPTTLVSNKATERTNCIRFRHLRSLAVAIVLMQAGVAVQADTLEAPQLDWNMFGSVGLAGIDSEEGLENGASSYNNYKNDADPDEVTRIGIQSRVSFNADWQFTLQASIRGSLDYQPTLEFAYLSHYFNPRTQLRIGRIRRPLYQFSESMNVGYAYNWTRPPVLTYFSFEGYYAPLTAADISRQGRWGSVDYTLGGYIGLGDKGSYDLLGFETGYSTRFNGGLSLALERGNLSTFVGMSAADFDFEPDNNYEVVRTLNLLGYPDIARQVDARNGLATFYSLGAKYLLGTWEFSAETTLNQTNLDSLSDLIGNYVAVHREFNGQFTLGYTLSRQRRYLNKSPQEDLLTASAAEASAGNNFVAGALQQLAVGYQEYVNNSNHDSMAHTLSFRYDFDSHAALKLELEHMTMPDLDRSFNSAAVVVDFVY